ncbi:MAG: DEAD/DEAH box helicase [Bdellovibrionia bacterium]
MLFEQLPLSSLILKSLVKQGFSAATPIQAQAIPVIMEGSDLVAKAQTGSGKTGAYLIPLMSKLAEDREARILILVPVRELAEQVKTEVEKLGSAARLKTAVITGGKSYRWQIKDTEEAQVIVATPGRLLDLMDSGSLPEFEPSTLVIDEADRMLDMGFIDDVKKILQYFSAPKQTLLFSATYPREIMNLVKNFMKEPVTVEVAQESKTNLDITQRYAVVPYQDKEAALIRLLEARSSDKIIVFSNTKKGADELGHSLHSIGITNLILHGDTEQKNREKVIRSFKSGHARVLIATDIAARGLDIKDIGLVINYDVPKDFDTYVHRIGRTGRAGAKGEAISLVEPGEIRTFFSLQRVVKAKVEFITVPNHADLMKSWEEDLFAKMDTQQPDNLARKAASMIMKSENLEQDLARLIQMVLGSKVLRGADKIGFTTPPKEESKPTSGGRFDRPSSGRGSSRGGGRSSYRGSDRGGERSSDRGGERGGYRSSERSEDRGGYRGGEERGAGERRPRSGTFSSRRGASAPDRRRSSDEGGGRSRRSPLA